MFAKKSYGQNFLVSESVVRTMIDAADLQEGEIVLEIGPGKGAITGALVAAGAQVVAVEADRDLIEPLARLFPSIDLIAGDALAMTTGGLWVDPPSDLGYKLVANLPYHIASHVLRRFLTTPPRPTRLVVMVQREVADRLLAKPPEMSMLSVACQMYASCKKLKNVPPGAFRPAPNVESALVQLDVFPQPPQESEAILQLAKIGFSSRRKQLQRNLADAKIATPIVIRDAIEQAGEPAAVRAENLTVSQWINLYEILKNGLR